MPVSHNRGNNEPAPESVSPDSRANAGFLELARLASALKTVSRTGWLDRGVATENVESVADHSYGVALLAWAAAQERQAQGAPLDPSRVLALALLHDLAEAATGDMTPYDPATVPDESDPEARRAFLDRRHARDEVRAKAKRAAEDTAMDELISAMAGAAGSMLSEMWEELRRGESAEARFVKQVDRLETFLQSLRYQQSDPNLPVESFRLEVIDTIDDPLLIEIRDAALKSWTGQ